MTKKYFSLNYDLKIDGLILKKIVNKGFSRIPVYSGNDKNNIEGILMIKKFIGINFLKPISIKDLVE